MRGRGGAFRVILAAVLAGAASLFAVGVFASLLAALGAVATTVVVVAIARRAVGGITGDIFGAVDELSSLTALILLAAVLA
jgi:adenosylcobinamide-GDP ribazoletransferase